MSSQRMSPIELRASITLAAIFALRMLGLFLILPVFAVYAKHLPGGHSTAMVGLAIGIYGLTQACLQIPFGIASDRYGRKPVILVGLVLFGLGSFIAALAPSVEWIIVGRALQGAGAISAAITALIADSTRDEHRTKAMAMVGASIGLTFAISLVLAPVLYSNIGMQGIFSLTGGLCLVAMATIIWVVPNVPLPHTNKEKKTPWRSVLLHTELLRLNAGIFLLHLVQMAMFVVVPVILVEKTGVPLSAHWKIYLPVVLGSFIIMVPLIFSAERRDQVKKVFLLSIALILAVQILLVVAPPKLVWLTALLLVFFVGFNVLEANLPSLISKLAPRDAKGAALGIYNTSQSLGLFVGGAAGGWLAGRWGYDVIFESCAILMILWLVIAAGGSYPLRRTTQSIDA